VWSGNLNLTHLKRSHQKLLAVQRPSEWTQVFKTERLAVAMLDRVTHRANILEMNGESFRLRSAKGRKAQNKPG
jgi:DNA replication protein DnaC